MSVTEKIKVNGDNLVGKVRGIIKEGNARKIIVKNNEGKTYLEVPIAVGAIGVAVNPVLAALGALAAYGSDFTIEVEKKEK